MRERIQFKAARKASLSDFFKDKSLISDQSVYDDTLDFGLKKASEQKLDYIKKLAINVQGSLLEGFRKSGCKKEKVEKLKSVFAQKLSDLNYENLEYMSESLTGSFLGLMVVLGLSQKINGSDYWSNDRGWKTFDRWLEKINKNIFELDEEVKSIFGRPAKA